MIPDSTWAQPAPPIRTIYPYAAAAIHGITFYEGMLYALDATTGYLLAIDSETHDTRILNPHTWQDFVGGTGLAIAHNTLWFTRGEDLYFCSLEETDH
ncbi:MAG: transglutaminase, partial [Spirulina sp. DLM2.Bin59]